MKLQYLAVVFVIIIIPISLVMSSYIQNQIDAITLQTAYDKNLISATYDAVKAFQLNTTNNKYASISDSKIRDVEASVNTFFNSLNTSMLEYSQGPKDLQGYIPAILFTLYDGYYIHTSYDNVYETKEDGKKVDMEKLGDTNKNYQNGLKPYVYYSAKYKLGNNIIVVNYTLDNEITVYGDVGDGKGYVTKSGYLINPNIVEFDDDTKTVIYGEGTGAVTIGPEELEEHLIILDESGVTTEGDYNYIFYQNKKIYQDRDASGNNSDSYFWYDNYMKTPVNDIKIKEYLIGTKTYSSDRNTIMSLSAFNYYKEAKEFSDWVVDYLGEITQADTIKSDQGTQTIGSDTEYLSENTGNTPIFDTTKNDNNPLVSDSTFNNHRLAVIRKTIETSLNTVISNYHSTTLYDYAMPIMSDDDWYSILNNVSMVTFMQGMSIGYRYYNNYAIITNNVNKEVVKTENIYIVTEDESENREYHQPGCKELLEGLESRTLTIAGAYPTASFQRQSVKVSENSDEDENFYYQSRGVEDSNRIINGKKFLTGCYNCIVNATAEYDVDDIIEGNDLIDFANRTESGGNGQVSFKQNNDSYKKVRQAYMLALARERYDLYKSNFDLSNLAN